MSAALLQILRSSGPCIDSPALLQALARAGLLRSILVHIFRLKFSPVVLERIRELPLPAEERSRLFTLAVSSIYTGGSYKTTGAGRTVLADQAVLQWAASFEAPTILEVGASDGSASLELLRRLPKSAQLHLTDRHPVFYRRGPRQCCLILDGSGRVLSLKVPGFLLTLPLRARLELARALPIDTLNPLLSEVHAVRAIEAFDALLDRFRKPAHIIKCANLLNQAYFPPESIRAALANLGASLAPGGVLVLSQNNPKYADGEALIVLQRQGDRLQPVHESGDHESRMLVREGLPCA